MHKRIAIVGGGLSGLCAAYELAQRDAPVDVTLFESTGRVGGTVETVRRDGFVIECGPDGWVSEKPWARDLAIELGLADQLLPSSDAGRKTYILRRGELVATPDGMQMMVPTDLDAARRSSLFSPRAIAAFLAEMDGAETLRAMAPSRDESVADLVRRHFGNEVLETVAAPLLRGVLGGDVERLSARAVLPQMVAAEREYGSLILGLQRRQRAREGRPGQALRDEAAGGAPAIASGEAAASGIFTTLRGGLGGLTDALAARIPANSIRLGTEVLGIAPQGARWSVRFIGARSHPAGAGAAPRTTDGVELSASRGGEEHFDAVVLAAPLDTTRRLLAAVDAEAAHLLPAHASSAILLGFAWADARLSPRDRRRSGKTEFTPPPGFGFLVPSRSGVRGVFGPQMLAATFADQKFAGRVPAGGRLVRVFFGGVSAERLGRLSDERLTARALDELRRIIGPLPAAPPMVVARRWPHSLPQYEVGHLERAARFHERLERLPNLHLLGNALTGVGLPDLVRDARALAQTLLL